MEVRIQVSPKQSIEFENRFDPSSLHQLVVCPCCFQDVVIDTSARKIMFGNLSSQINLEKKICDWKKILFLIEKLLKNLIYFHIRKCLEIKLSKN